MGVESPPCQLTSSNAGSFSQDILRGLINRSVAIFKSREKVLGEYIFSQDLGD